MSLLSLSICLTSAFYGQASTIPAVGRDNGWVKADKPVMDGYSKIVYAIHEKLDSDRQSLR